MAIIVGEEKQKFYVHSHLLESTGEFFQKILTVAQESDNMRTVKLLDSDTDAFSIYAKWLYTGRFHPVTPPSTQSSDCASQQMCWDEMLSCYILSHAIRSSDFGDATIDAFLRRMEIGNDTPVELAKWIYPRTKPNSAHRRLCLDIVLHTWDRKQLPKLCTDEFPGEFMEDVVAQMSAKFERGVKRKEVAEFLEYKGACEYHEHVRLKAPCYKLRLGQ